MRNYSYRKYLEDAKQSIEDILMTFSSTTIDRFILDSCSKILQNSLIDYSVWKWEFCFYPGCGFVIFYETFPVVQFISHTVPCMLDEVSQFDVAIKHSKRRIYHTLWIVSFEEFSAGEFWRKNLTAL